MITMAEKITIVGASFGGLCTAIALQKLGIDTKVFECSPKQARLNAGIVIGANSLKVLNTLGIGEQVLAEGSPQDKYTVYSTNGKVLTTSDYVDSYVSTYIGIHRAKLIDILISQLKPGTIYYNKGLDHFKNTEDGIDLYFQDGSIEKTDYLIAADGLNSTVRQLLIPNHSLRYTGYTCWRGIVKDCPDTLLQKFSETWGEKGKIGLVPLKDKKVYWYAYKSSSENNPEYNKWNIGDVLFNFYNYHTPIPQILDRMKQEDLIHHDLYDFEPLSQYKYGRVVLIGDAAHAAAPTMGQGANQAIEDALTLSYCLSNMETVDKAFQEFEAQRLEYTRSFVQIARKFGEVSKGEIASIWSRRDQYIKHKTVSI